MKSVWFGVAIVAATSASMAAAGEKPLYAPTPAWVTAAPPIDAVKAAATPGALLILDQQQRLQDGQVWSYIDSANRILSEQMLAQAGTISLTWQPDQGDLIVHRIVIVRGNREIDVVAGGEPLTVLRRELGLETLALDGVLTATMPLPGLQVGDIVRLSYSTTRKDPLLGGQLQSTGFLLTEPGHADYARLRVLWRASDKVRWQAMSPIKSAPVPAPGGMSELTVMLPLPKPKELPADAPPRFNPLPILEVSSFADWEAVSRTMAPLYRTAGLVKPAGALAAEIARIKAASPDPKVRAAAALRSVQGDVRYLFNGLDHGNYKPQPPELTWEVRYGDCKAKALLLLTMLDGLGIEAEPILASTELADFLPKRLPSAAAFNHILVRATIAGQAYWLDGTASGTRLEDLGDSPPLRFVLPLRTAGATLLPVPTHPNGRPTLTLDLDVDMSAGAMLPVPFTASLALVGPAGEGLRTAAAGLTGDKRKEELDKVFGRFLPNAVIATRDVSYDAKTGVATLHGTGLAAASWRREAQHYELLPTTMVETIELQAIRGRPEWRDIPVATPGVGALMLHTRVHLPNAGKGFTIDNDRILPAMLGGRLVKRTVTKTADMLTIDERLDEVGTEIAPADVAAAKAGLALAKSRPLKLIAPSDYPLRFQIVRASTAAGRLKPIETAFGKAIDDAAEKGPVYLRRAQYRASIFDYKTAITDFDRAIAERGEVEAYQARGFLFWATGQSARAIADFKTALDMDPSALNALFALSKLQGANGELDAALARLDERIEAGGDNKKHAQVAKAEVLADAGQIDAALALMDDAITSKPGDGELLNARCWIKGSRNVQLESALKDCNRALELIGDGAAATLHSRAMVYFRLARVDEAVADLDAALDIDPELGDAHMLRGIIRRHRGDAAGAEIDMTQARTDDPRIEGNYKRYGLVS